MKSHLLLLLFACAMPGTTPKSMARPYELAFSTFFGGSAGEGIRDVEVDGLGNIYVAGTTRSADFPVSADAYQPTKGSKDDAVIVKLSSSLDRLVYGTFLGGDGNDAGRAGCVAGDGSLIVAGSSSGGSWPTGNAFQKVSKGPSNAIIARFAGSIE